MLILNATFAKPKPSRASAPVNPRVRGNVTDQVHSHPLLAPASSLVS